MAVAEAGEVPAAVIPEPTAMGLAEEVAEVAESPLPLRPAEEPEAVPVLALVPSTNLVLLYSVESAIRLISDLSWSNSKSMLDRSS